MNVSILFIMILQSILETIGICYHEMTVITTKVIHGDGHGFPWT